MPPSARRRPADFRTPTAVYGIGVTSSNAGGNTFRIGSMARACSSAEPNPATTSAKPLASWYCSGTKGAGGALRPAMKGVMPAGTSLTKSRQKRNASVPWSTGQKKSPRLTRGPTSCSWNSNVVTTPKLPPPPLSAHNNSGFSAAEAATILPSAVTICAEIRLSQLRPANVESQPMSPPRVRPATPVVLTKPPVTARPCACVAASNSPHVVPPPHVTRRAAGSTWISFSRLRSIIRPSSQTA
jgi:hypothetical protein